MFCLSATGRTMQLFHLIFTRPGKVLLVQPRTSRHRNLREINLSSIQAPRDYGGGCDRGLLEVANHGQESPSSPGVPGHRRVDVVLNGVELVKHL